MEKILVIDDDTDICLLLKRFLTKNNYEVEIAHNGKSGLAILDEFRPNLVITDFKLGDIDGGQLLVNIKEKYPHMPVLIITGYSDIKVAVNVMKQGAFDYVTKPFFRMKFWLPSEKLWIVLPLVSDGLFLQKKRIIRKRISQNPAGPPKGQAMCLETARNQKTLSNRLNWLLQPITASLSMEKAVQAKKSLLTKYTKEAGEKTSLL